ncbi:MAG: methylmalonyl-CoA mutase family protein [Candidatus Aminicenantes bacterium]|jgi:methylmalonyl-CoA mutase N-terminal domain/subunit
MTKERKKSFQTHSGIDIKGVYNEDDLSSFESQRDLGLPGEYPFIRGVYPTMYRSKFWTMRQYAGFGMAEDSNERYRFLLSKGQTGLSVAFDLPTQLGLDSDHPQALGEVGKVGVAIDTLEDMDALFADIPLEKVSVSMTINATAAILLAMYLVLAEQRGIPWEKLSGTIQNDLLKEYIARGTYIFPPRPSMKIVVDIISFCQEKVPQWNTMSISGYHIREAGATAVQELAFTLADAIAYVEAAIGSGLDVDAFAPRLSFFLASHNNVFEEIAKFRAARRLWARIMREKFQAKNPQSWKFRFHTQTSGVTLAAQQPENNVVRVTLQALSAVLGGTQSLHTNSRDEALALPSQESAQLALRTQQIIAHETGLPDTADPLGGSFFVESLTSAIEEKVLAYLKKIEDLGGMLKAIETGFIQKEVQDSAYGYQKLVESGEQIIVGLNAFASEQDAVRFEIYQPPEELEKNQIAKLRTVKERRDGDLVSEALRELKKAAESQNNVMTPLLSTVKTKATLGEITAVLKDVYGTHTENVNF